VETGEGAQRYRVLDVAYSPWGDIATVEVSGDWLRLGACAAWRHTPAGTVVGTYSFTGGGVDSATYQMVMRGGFRPE
jgi:hypothetical protein